MKISSVIAVRNEGVKAKDALMSLLPTDQFTETISFEFLLLDGMSDADTRRVLDDLKNNLSKATGCEVKVLDNHEITAPNAFNLGIEHSTGDFIAILGAHAIYSKSYLSTCIEEMQRHGADVCSGYTIQYFPESPKLEEDLSYAIHRSKFAVSGSSFRTVKPGFVESVPYGVFKREVFEKVGLYNTRLTRNQDNDMNTRILKAGFKLYLTDKASAIYKGSLSYNGLLKYAFRNGYWNSKTLFISPGAMRLRHFVPLYFLIFIIIVPILAYSLNYFNYGIMSNLTKWFYLGVVALYFVLAIYLTPRDTRFALTRILFPIAVFIFHLSYGLGNLTGLFSLENFKR